MKNLNELADEYADDMELLGEERRKSKNDYKAGFREGNQNASQSLETLKAIATWPGNLSDTVLRSATGANDASYRGEMVITMRDLANQAIVKYESS